MTNGRNVTANARFVAAQQAETLPFAAHAGDEWTNVELRQLERLRAEGFTVTAIARQLGRSYSATQTRLALEGFVRPRKRPATRPVLTPAAPVCAACWLVHAGTCA